MADKANPLRAGDFNPATGNLRLQPSSPAIDRGSNFVDTDRFHAGQQPLGPLDLDGNPRIVDGDGDGAAIVDMGAYEKK